MSELWRLSALELRRAFDVGEVSAREILEAHMRRIEQINPEMNAVTVLFADSGIAAAAECDRRRARGEPARALEAVPATVKESVEVAGSASTMGVVAFPDRVPPVDAPVIARLRDAGAVLVGRANLPDFGMRWHTDNALHGTTRSPWRRERTPGGSSGGDAVAVATGMASIGLGSDFGGSLRVPAHWCGVATIKPTNGLIPWASSIDPGSRSLAAASMSTNGPIARTVADLTASLGVLAGPDPRDPWTVAVEPVARMPRRFAVAEFASDSVDAAIAAGIDVAASALEEAGYERAEVPPPSGTWEDLWARLVFSEIDLEAIASLLSPDALRFLNLCFEARPPLTSARELSSAYGERERLAHAWSVFQAEAPLILAPPMTRPPFEIGYDLRDSDAAADILAQSRYLHLANVLGLPAAVLPTGMADGLPVAVQVIGPRYGDALVLSAAAEIERQVGTLTPVDLGGGPVAELQDEAALQSLAPSDTRETLRERAHDG